MRALLRPGMHALLCAASTLRLAPPAAQLAPAAAVSLRFSEVGSRFNTKLPALVVIHGLLGSGGNFHNWASALSRDCEAKGKPRRVILLDLRNHGESEHAHTMSFDEMAADVLRLLDEQGIQRAVICGHSLGGKVAMALALRNPERVDRLLVLDIAPARYDADDGTGWGDNVKIINQLRKLDVQNIKKKSEADAILARHVQDAGLRAFVLMNLVRRSGEGFAWRINLEGIANSLDDLADWDFGDLPRYDGNTLFVTGGQSKYVRSSHLANIQEQFVHFSISKIRNANHWIHADEPEALLVITSNFLDVPSVAPR